VDKSETLYREDLAVSSIFKVLFERYCCGVVDIEYDNALYIFLGVRMVWGFWLDN
jgi:hypothetical protein